MKNRIFLICSLCLLLCFGACTGQDREQIELLDAEKTLFQYTGTENAKRIAVDEAGMLYTTEFVMGENLEGNMDLKQKVSVYDLQGTCTEVVDLPIGSGDAQVLYAEAGYLYFVIFDMSKNKPVLYEVNPSTWEIRERFCFSSYKIISEMVRIEDYIYVIGQLENPEAKQYELHPEVLAYNYGGEAISRINITEEYPIEQQLSFDFPISIFRTEKGLGIYAYDERKGFGIIELNHAAGTLEEKCWKVTITPSQYFTKCEKGYLYYNLNYGRMYYGNEDGTEADITGTIIRMYEEPDYTKGFVFYKNEMSGGMVERICVADILQENREIKLLMHKDTMDIPYGCGYQMEKNTLDSESFSLKVLAQDRDYDVYVLSSRNPVAYNLKKNGAFYPLNEVEGVEEYLDACFPYLKELATNEDGDIWMIPVALAIPGLEYNKEYCTEQGVDLSTMNFEEFLKFTQENEKTVPEFTNISYMFLLESFFSQYFQQEVSFDTEMFRKYTALLKEGYEIEGASWGIVSGFTAATNAALKEGEPIPDYYYETQYYLTNIMNRSRILQDKAAIGVTAIPTMKEGVVNQGTVTLLAVNPQSDNLETTLDYISAFSKYMLTKKDSFVLEDESTYSDTPYLRDWYQVYACGGAYFEMDREIYNTIYWDYLEGELEQEEMIVEIERRRKLYMGE